MKCPVCSDIATRHFDHQRVYWFCQHCWQEIPKFETSPPPRTLSNGGESDPMMARLQERIVKQRQELLLPYH